MNFFTNKKFLFKLIVSICLCLILIGFNMSTVLQAATDTSILTDEIEKVEVISKAADMKNYEESQVLAWGGQILQPIVDLVMSLGDGIMNIIQVSIMGGMDAYIPIDKTRNWILTIVAVILVAIVTIILFVVTAGAIAAVAAAAGSALSSAAAAGGILGLAAKGALGIGGATLAAVKGATVVVAVTLGAVASLEAVSFVDDKMLPTVTVLPLYSVSPQELFRGDILLFDVNLFNPKQVMASNGESATYMLNGEEITTDESVYYYIDQEGNKVITSQQSSAYELKTVISKWYYTFRNIAIVILMVILVYVGIKILLSSVASDKAKYKQMLFDWGVALCLVFVIHYIMVFAVNLTESVVEMLKSTSKVTNYVDIIDFRDSDHIDAYEEAIEEGGLNPEEFIRDEPLSDDDEANAERLFWPTNLIGHARIQAQYMDGTASYIGYALCYIVLVLYTVYFTFTYAKRLLYITFLTVIAPLVSITYPIDKMNDGKAQAFDIWFKEYIFNLLIQPLHLMLYTVLISMAFEFAGTNIIYCVVAIGFMMPAEKFLRKMFNFEKASTPGLLGGAGGAALVMSGLNALSRIGGSHKNNKGNGDSNTKDTDRIRGYDSNRNFDNVMGGLQQEPNQLPQQDNNEAARRAMLEADEDNFGTEEFDAQQHDALARELTSEQDQGQQYSEDEYRQILMDSGYEGEDLERMMIEGGYGDDEPQLETIEDEPEQPPEDLDDESEELLEEEESQPSGASRIMSAWGKGIAATGKRTIKNIPSMAGAGLRLAGGLTGATIGLAAGISSGDISKTVQYTTAGGVAGKTISGIPANKISGAIENSKKQQEQFEKDYYGADYSKHKREQLDYEFQRDRGRRKEYAQELGIDKKYKKQMTEAKAIEDIKVRNEKIRKIKEERKQETDRVMKEALEYRKFNVTDDSVIIKAMQIDKNKPRNNRASKDKIASAMIATNAKNQKDVDEYMKRLRKQGVSETETETIARNAKIINPNI